MGRPSFHELYMDLAVGMSRRSTCRRLKVGCTIVSTDFFKVLSVGYNGNATGLKNDCDSDVPGACGCLHAEENAVISCDVPRDTKKIVFCSNLPCVMCAKRLINLGGVERIYYLNDYRIRDSIKLLSGVRIPVTSMKRHRVDHRMDEIISLWHAGRFPDSFEIYDALKLTWEQYGKWVENADNLPEDYEPPDPDLDFP